ncbi:pilus assembly protein [Pseudomonas sp. KCA11]|uniref:TadE/TadG family type IV pilus assembly protein n=1 Tax=unclassified Pseudomonas TaxID=196821 RepID=UPI001F308B87|nr:MULTISPECIES: TadE/TadG family type IV pilus assembly protein [unclassified Pseudomonas]MCE5992772.1 pilus assembly protein [Pseudomonas sp. KCA11]UMY60713.1 pilus assembly protein [Pseudomonas sp. LS.1a]
MELHRLKRAQRQQGVAIVEFTITLPLLLLTLLAFGEFGRMLYQYNSLLQGSRDAARFVASQAWNSTLGKVEVSADLECMTKKVAVYGAPSAPPCSLTGMPANITVQVAKVAGTSDHVQVTISSVFSPLVANGIPAFIGGSTALNFPLVATTVMRAL